MEPLNYEQKAMLNAMKEREAYSNTNNLLIVILGGLILVIVAVEGVGAILSAIMGAFIILLHQADGRNTKQLKFLRAQSGYKNVPELDKSPELPKEE